MLPEVFHHYKTGNTELDSRHWAIISKLDDAVTASSVIPIKPISYVLFLFDEGIKSVEEEFQLEDLEMIKNGFPYYRDHEANHRLLIRALTELRGKIESKISYFSINYSIYMWQRSFLEHIDHFDFQCVKHCQNIK